MDHSQVYKELLNGQLHFAREQEALHFSTHNPTLKATSPISKSIAFTMKLFGLPIVLLTALQLQSAAAAMYIYQSQDSVSGTGADIYNFFKGHPSCNDVNKAVNYMGRDDVSGGKHGVSCDGNGCWNGKPNDIKRLEMNTKFGHYSESLLSLLWNGTNQRTSMQPSTRTVAGTWLIPGTGWWALASLPGRTIFSVVHPLPQAVLAFLSARPTSSEPSHWSSVCFFLSEHTL